MAEQTAIFKVFTINPVYESSCYFTYRRYGDKGIVTAKFFYGYTTNNKTIFIGFNNSITFTYDSIFKCYCLFKSVLSFNTYCNPKQ